MSETDTEAAEVCPFCGSEINPGATVCASCGAFKASKARNHTRFFIFLWPIVAWTFIIFGIKNESLATIGIGVAIGVFAYKRNMRLAKLAKETAWYRQHTR